MKRARDDGAGSWHVDADLISELRVDASCIWDAARDGASGSLTK